MIPIPIRRSTVGKDTPPTLATPEDNTPVLPLTWFKCLVLALCWVYNYCLFFYSLYKNRYMILKILLIIFAFFFVGSLYGAIMTVTYAMTWLSRLYTTFITVSLHL